MPNGKEIPMYAVYTATDYHFMCDVHKCVFFDIFDLMRALTTLPESHFGLYITVIKGPNSFDLDELKLKLQTQPDQLVAIGETLESGGHTWLKVNETTVAVLVTRKPIGWVRLHRHST